MPFSIRILLTLALNIFPDQKGISLPGAPQQTHPKRWIRAQTGYMRNVVAWLGLDEVRATKPVTIGDSITVEASVIEARPTSKPSSGVWTLSYTTRNQHGDAVMTFRSSFLVSRTPEGNQL